MDAVVSSSSRICIQAMHDVASIAAERDIQNEGSSACVPPALPLESSELPSAEFNHPLSDLETRLLQGGMFTLVRTVAKEPSLEHSPQKPDSNASGFFNFSRAWSPIYRRFPILFKVAYGLLRFYLVL